MRIRHLLALLVIALTGTLVVAQAEEYPILFRSGEILDIEGIGPFRLYQLDPTTGESRPVPDIPEGSVSEISWSSDGSQFAFTVSTAPALGLQPGPLYVMNAECLSLPEGCGTSLRMLTGEEGTVDEASWSPDNAHIAYVGLEHSEATSGIINVISAEDGTVVNSFEGSSLRWSPDGTQIAFLRPQPDMNFIYDLYVADALGGEVKQLTDGVGNVDAFAWHPLGEEITYVYYELPNNDRTGDLYAINPDSSAVRNITNTGTVGSTFAWSPDGTWVMFADEMGDYYLLNQDGTSHLVADNPEHGFRTAPPKWSPDSTQVVFEFPSSESTLEYTLWTLHAVDVATRTVKDLSPNLDTEGNYSWSPDSTQVVFMGKLNADIEIYTVSPDGSAAPRQLTDYPDYYDTNPIWQPVSG